MNEMAIFREKIVRLENALLQFPQAHQHIHHTFGHKVVLRQMAVPKGSVVTGKVHKHKQINMLLIGEMAVYAPEGLLHLKAPYMYVSEPGAKRAFYALEDSIWACIAGTEVTDPDELEDSMVVSSFEEYDAFEQKQLELL